MYNIDQTRLNQLLQYLERRLDLLEQLGQRSDIAQDEIAIHAMERCLQMSIEAIIDVGNLLIDAFIMRDPGSYTDIVDILLDEGVVESEPASVLTNVVSFRRQLVNEYTSVPAQEMVELVRSSLPVLRTFAPSVRQFVEKELF